MDKITDKPAIVGRGARAWLIDLEAARKRRGVPPNSDATIVHWVLEAPWAHPLWHSYSVVCIHLRPLAHHHEIKFYLDGATHEIWVISLDPRSGSRQKLLEYATWGVEGSTPSLNPPNFASQFIEISDDLAIERVARAIEQVCDGELSPDTDYIQSWVELFGSNMIRRQLWLQRPE